MAQVTNADGSRYYLWPAADRSSTVRHFSVTTIIDLGVPKPQLKQWAATMAAEWAVKNLEAIQALRDRGRAEVTKAIPLVSLQAIAEPGDGLPHEWVVDPDKLRPLLEAHTAVVVDDEETEKGVGEAVGLIKMAHKRTSNRAALKGSHVHKAIEAYVRDADTGVVAYPGVPLMATPMYAQFLKFLEHYRPTFLQSEARVYNRAMRWAGTLDAIATFSAEQVPAIEKWFGKPEVTLLLDIKTGKGGKRGAYPEAALQMAAYAHAEFIAGPEGSEIEMPTVDGAAVIHLQDSFYEVIPMDIGDDVYDYFLHAYQVAAWQEFRSKNVILEKLPPLKDHPDPAVPDPIPVEKPCPYCGWECEPTNATGRAPKWRCSNPDCVGGKGDQPWASWRNDPWKKDGEVQELQAAAEAEAAAATKAAEVPDDEDAAPAAEQATLEGVKE